MQIDIQELQKDCERFNTLHSYQLDFSSLKENYIDESLSKLTSSHFLSLLGKDFDSRELPNLQNYFLKNISTNSHLKTIYRLMDNCSIVIPKSSFFTKLLTPQVVDHYFQKYSSLFSISHFLSLHRLGYFQNNYFQDRFYKALEKLSPTLRNAQDLLLYLTHLTDEKVFQKIIEIFELKINQGNDLAPFGKLISKIKNSEYQKKLLDILHHQEQFFISEKPSAYIFSINMSIFKNICKKYHFKNPMNTLHSIHSVFAELKEQNHFLWKDILNDSFLQLDNLKKNSFIDQKIQLIILNQFSFHYSSEKDKSKKLDTLKIIFQLLNEHATKMETSAFEDFLKDIILKTSYQVELSQNLSEKEENNQYKKNKI
jgi:hypothetical protein